MFNMQFVELEENEVEKCDGCGKKYEKIWYLSSDGIHINKAFCKKCFNENVLKRM